MFARKEKSQTWKTNLGLLILSTFVCLLLIELTLRLFLPFYFAQPIEAFEYDKELAYRFRPGTHFFVTTDYQQEIRTNQIGSLNFQEDLSEYSTIIFALGDSYTQGLGVSVDSSFPFQLDLILNLDDKDIYSKRYGIVNLALGPYGAKQQLITLERFARDLRKPDIVLYLGCENDHSDNLLFDSGVRHKNIVRGNPHYGWFYYPMKWFFIDTEIGKRLKSITQEMISKNESYRNQHKESNPRSVAEMEIGEIEKIIRTAREFGAVTILSWASFGDSYDWLQSWSLKNDVLFADWKPASISISDSIPGLPWNNSHSAVHYRPWVNFVIAQSFAKEIKKITASSELSSN